MEAVLPAPGFPVNSVSTSAPDECQAAHELQGDSGYDGTRHDPEEFRDASDRQEIERHHRHGVVGSLGIVQKIVDRHDHCRVCDDPDAEADQEADKCKLDDEADDGAHSFLAPRRMKAAEIHANASSRFLTIERESQKGCQDNERTWPNAS